MARIVVYAKPPPSQTGTLPDFPGLLAILQQLVGNGVTITNQQQARAKLKEIMATEMVNHGSFDFASIDQLDVPTVRAAVVSALADEANDGG